MQQTCIIIKPEQVLHRAASAEILHQLCSQGFLVCGVGELRPPKEVFAKHYAHLSRSRDFDWILDYMTIGPVLVLIFTGKDAVESLRMYAGSSSDPPSFSHSLRYAYQFTSQFNAIHSSDSPENANSEVFLWMNYLPIKNDTQKAMHFVNRYIGDYAPYLVDVEYGKGNYKNKKANVALAKLVSDFSSENYWAKCLSGHFWKEYLHDFFTGKKLVLSQKFLSQKKFISKSSFQKHEQQIRNLIFQEKENYKNVPHQHEQNYEEFARFFFQSLVVQLGPSFEDIFIGVFFLSMVLLFVYNFK